MSRIYDVMVAGHLCIDIIPKFSKTGLNSIGDIMRPGKLVNVEEAKISTGGPVSNTGINMKTFGKNVCFCACVGDDILGRMTVDILKKNGNSEGIQVIHGLTSSYTIVIAPAGIDRIFLHNPGSNDNFTSEYLNSDLISKCCHFHFGYPPLMKCMFENDGRDLQNVFKIAKEAGATTSCDMTLPDPDSDSGKVNWRKVLSNILPYIDIYLPSIEETFYMLEPENFLRMKQEHNNAELIDFISPARYSKFSDELIGMGSKIVALKSGHRGFYIKTSNRDSFDDIGHSISGCLEDWVNRELWTPAFVVEEFGSATGSGDSSIAGFLSGYLGGYSIEKSLKYAVCAGLQNMRVLDAVSGVKTWEETTEMIESNLEMIDIHNTEKGWKYSQQDGLWIGPMDKRV